MLFGFKKKIYILDSPPVKNNCRRAREIFFVCALNIEKFLSKYVCSFVYKYTTMYSFGNNFVLWLLMQLKILKVLNYM